MYCAAGVVFMQHSLSSLAQDPNQKLLDLLAASDQIMAGILRHDRKASYQLVADSLGRLVGAESCALFLVPLDDPGVLHLQAQSNSPGAVWDGQHRRIAIGDTPGGGLTAWIAAQGKPVKFTAHEIKDHPNWARTLPTHFGSAEVHPLLAVPLMSKSRCLGLLKAEKRAGAVRLDQDPGFTEQDLQIACLFANKALLLIENGRVTDSLRELFNDASKADNVDGIFRLILTRALHLLGADRADIAWYERDARQLVLRSTLGGTCGLQIGMAIPVNSVIRKVWEQERPQNLPDVKDVGFYHCLDDSTVSEVAVLVQHEGQKVGVINAESTALGGFAERDREILELLAQHAALALTTHERSVQFRERVLQLSNLRSQALKDLLQDLLSDLRKQHGFDAALIYIPDYANRRLECRASIGCEECQVDPDDFSYYFHEPALATKVYREKEPYLSLDPWSDRHVSPDGLKAFDIRGPILGKPLEFRGDPVGALVVWSRQAPPPTEQSIGDLGPLALIAALASGLTTTAERRTISAATFGHSLRQPLATLQMLVEDTLDKSRRAGHDDLQSHLEHLVAQTRLVVRLADQRRTYNRLRGVQNPREKIHLAALLSSCLKSWRTAADLKSVKVDLDLDGSPDVVFGNKDDLEEALGNVFDNALRFSEPGQRIGVSLFGELKEARVVIEDQGPGVTPDLRNRIFEPFVSTPHKGAPKGSGLGLAICSEVLVQHGGAIVYSEAKPRGASFCMTLPLVCDEVPARIGGASG